MANLGCEREQLGECRVSVRGRVLGGRAGRWAGLIKGALGSEEMHEYDL